jgi:hypothetical protein
MTILREGLVNKVLEIIIASTRVERRVRDMAETLNKRLIDEQLKKGD